MMKRNMPDTSNDQVEGSPMEENRRKQQYLPKERCVNFLTKDITCCNNMFIYFTLFS